MINHNFVKLAIILMASLLYMNSLYSQKNDYNWLFGLLADNPNYPELIADSLLWGATNFDFNHDPVRIYRDKNRYTDFLATNATFSRESGELFSYSNGHHIYAADDSINEGGDSTLYGPYWELFVDKKEITGLGFDWEIGLNVPQSILYLPSPSDKDQLYMINQFINYHDDNFTITANSLHYSLIDMKANSGKGQVIAKDVKILDTILCTGYVQATRHANGRDWWITVLGYKLTKMYTLLLDPNGIHLVHEDIFDIGWNCNSSSNIPITWSGNSTGQSVFSQNGSTYAMLLRSPFLESNPFHTIVLDFDRCTGRFSNLRRSVIPHEGVSGIVQGLALSPSGQYLYTGNGYALYQFDLTKPELQSSMRLVDNYDGFLSIFDRSTQFYRWLLAPDGRLYGTAQSGSCSHMHVIDYPDEKPLGCGLRQHGIKLPTSCANGMPNFANYRLGPLDGTACDTLGLDNHPIAKYRYTDDTIIYRRIRFTDLSYFRPETRSWDFGDGSPKISQRSPYHTYAQNGTYRVCLTVSNENSSNTFCRDITIGPSAVDDDQAEHPSDITIFPNPAQDILIVTIGEYIPERGYIELYNISGQQVHRQRAYYGHNNVDMSGLQAGKYILRFMDGNKMVKEEKVVKIE